MLKYFCISRGLATGIYTTNSPEACQYVAASCEANIVVVENQAQLSKILQVRSSTGRRVHKNSHLHSRKIMSYPHHVHRWRISCLTWRPSSSTKGSRSRGRRSCTRYVQSVDTTTGALKWSHCLNLCVFLQWSDFLKMGEDMTDQELNAVICSLRANECCTLIYTSGTTGNPKGVMLSHDNVSPDTQLWRTCTNKVLLDRRPLDGGKTIS